VADRDILIIVPVTLIALEGGEHLAGTKVRRKWKGFGQFALQAVCIAGIAGSCVLQAVSIAGSRRRELELQPRSV